MTLVDWQIRNYCHNGMVSPYLEENLQPASLDVRLDDTFLIPDPIWTRYIDIGDPDSFADLYRTVRADEFILHPGQFVLGATIEKVDIPDNIVARIEGRSSLGRLGLIVHATAGYIDPGYRGTITLEMANLLTVPIVLRSGFSVAQLAFEQTEFAQSPYKGRYQNDIGPKGSRYGH